MKADETMKTNEKELFLNNVAWFNQFFSDLKQLFEKIIKQTSYEFSHGTQSFYYPKSRYTPSIPPYYFSGVGGKGYALQVFAIIDPAMLRKHQVFTNEPCLIILKHSRSDRVSFVEDYGLRIFADNQIDHAVESDGVISGTILAGEGKGTQFYGFQVSLDAFIEGKNINEVIQKEVIDVLKEAPEW